MTRSRQASALALLATALLLVLWLVPRTAFAQGPTTSPTATGGLAVSAQATGDTARFIARWRRILDAAGGDDSARVVWTLNGTAQAPRVLRPGLGWVWMADTVRPLRAICPAPTTASATLTIYRRTRTQTATRSATMGCRDVPMPPVDSFVIDTGNVWRGALRVDSLPPAGGHWYQVIRADSSAAMVHVQRDRKTAAIIGATLTAPTTCPDGMWWHTGDTTSVRVAMARAAQWPTDTLAARATRAFTAFDYSGCAYCQVWQGRCG